MTDREALIALNLFTDIGSSRLKALLEACVTPEKIFSAKIEQLLAAGVSMECAEKIRSFNGELLSAELSAAKSMGVEIITCFDREYPLNLSTIPGYPLVLYVRGELREEDRFSIGIVGSRRASLYGLGCAEKFAVGLCAAGWTVVSGLARGIDTQAHRGALKSGKTQDDRGVRQRFQPYISAGKCRPG